MKLKEEDVSEEKQKAIRRSLKRSVLKLKKIQAKRLVYFKKIQLKMGKLEMEKSLPHLDKWKKRYGERTEENDAYWTDLDAGWERAGKYRSHTQSVFAEEGIPVEFADLAFQEAMWETKVKSDAGAKGAFQITSSTGRRVGLQIRAGKIDERLDPIQAARGSARNLQYTYDMIGKWEPTISNDRDRWNWALLAYNMNPSAVKKKYKLFNGDIEKYCKHESTAAEQANYPSKYQALRHVIENNYEGQIEQDPPIELTAIPLTYKFQKSTTYTIKEGDNITDIANKKPVSRIEIMNANLEANPNFDPKTLQIGQEIIIPKRTKGKKNAIFFREIVEILREAEVETPKKVLMDLNPHLLHEVTNNATTIPETNIYLPPEYESTFYECFQEKVLNKTDSEIKEVQRNETTNNALSFL